jgi:hypothetical protein
MEEYLCGEAGRGDEAMQHKHGLGPGGEARVAP